ncbi:MAG: DNA-binding protein [Spirochaetes bacterium]|nr:DNA-binding protein [Spirochaetota bacterium]
MKTKRIMGSIFFLSLLVGAMAIYAQRMHGAGYYYDPSKVITVSGIITSVETVERARGYNSGTHLEIKTDGGILSVYAGPSSFLYNKITFVKGDAVEVTGARVADDGKPGIVAREIRKGDKRIVLRNNDGTPLWAGHGERRGRHRW